MTMHSQSAHVGNMEYKMNAARRTTIAKQMVGYPVEACTVSRWFTR